MVVGPAVLGRAAVMTDTVATDSLPADWDTFAVMLLAASRRGRLMFDRQPVRRPWSFVTSP
jgi:hypothetical protein